MVAEASTSMLGRGNPSSDICIVVPCSVVTFSASTRLVMQWEMHLNGIKPVPAGFLGDLFAA